jgi:hypothetical protein
LIVVDTSAIVDLLLENPPNLALAERIDNATELHAPHLIDIEFLSVLRRLVLGGLLPAKSAKLARELFSQLPIERYPHTLFGRPDLGAPKQHYVLRRSVLRPQRSARNPARNVGQQARQSSRPQSNRRVLRTLGTASLCRGDVDPLGITDRHRDGRVVRLWSPGALP